jgi:hypothetical protein
MMKEQRRGDEGENRPRLTARPLLLNATVAPICSSVFIHSRLAWRRARGVGDIGDSCCG